MLHGDLRLLCTKEYSTFLLTPFCLNHQGLLEDTMLFYGYYSNITSFGDPTAAEYNMGIAYLCAVGVSFIVLFLLIVKK